MLKTLVIFDFDGVIVDSEYVFNKILAGEISRLGWHISAEDCIRLFVGKSSQTVDAMIQKKLNLAIPPHFRKEIRVKIHRALKKELRPIGGVEPLLREVKNKCIASNAELERIQLSLCTTKLLKYFAQSQIFSSQMVVKSKPSPDLFLLAAQEMKCLPEHCIVIEDSPLGIKAAHAANMKVAAFVGGAHTKSVDYRKTIDEANPTWIIRDIREVLQLEADLRCG